MKVREINKRIEDVKNVICSMDILTKLLVKEKYDDAAEKVDEAICLLGDYKKLLSELMNEAEIDIHI